MDKLIRDGQVAVIVSPGFGAGYLASVGLSDTYTGGWGQCQVEWVSQGQSFTITECDGSESLNYIEAIAMTA